jgi:CRP-like cAMP-binding protein
MSAVLSGTGLFEGLPADELRALGERAQDRSFAKDAVVIREGDAQNSLYIILRGRVKVFLPGEPEVVLAVKGPGEYFGEMILEDRPGSASASVVTLEPAAFAVISRGDFKAFLLKHPEVALQVIHNLIRLARGANEDARVREQLRKYVAELKSEAARPPESLKAWIIAKRWALAALLIVSALVFYFTEVFIEMLQLKGVSVFIR